MKELFKEAVNFVEIVPLIGAVVKNASITQKLMVGMIIAIAPSFIAGGVAAISSVVFFRAEISHLREADIRHEARLERIERDIYRPFIGGKP